MVLLLAFSKEFSLLTTRAARKCTDTGIYIWKRWLVVSLWIKQYELATCKKTPCFCALYGRMSRGRNYFGCARWCPRITLGLDWHISILFCREGNECYIRLKGISVPLVVKHLPTFMHPLAMEMLITNLRFATDALAFALEDYVFYMGGYVVWSELVLLIDPSE